MPAVLPRHAVAALAIALALLLPVAAVPDAVLYNQLAAVAGWGLWLSLSQAQGSRAKGAAPASAALATVVTPLAAATLALAMCALLSAMRFGLGQAPAMLVLLAAVAVLSSGARHGSADFDAAALAWWLAGLLCIAIAAVQYFVPALANGWLVATNASPGRAVGNLRQPNHLATALLCSMTMTAWLWQARHLAARWAAVSLVAMVFAVALSASRTGALALVVLLAWAALDRSLPRALRWLLAATPLVYLASWAALAAYASIEDASFYAGERLEAAGDISSSRFAIWRNALALIARNPWTGVGWGNFNFAWTFTPFPDRPVAFFDHTHNLPLQLAVEIGLPATVAVLGLLGWALWRARSAWRGEEPASAGRLGGVAAAAPEGRRRNAAASALGKTGPHAEPPSIARAALAMLLVLGLHSLLEYPLWYAYFLLPGAWALGALLGAAGRTGAPTQAAGAVPASALRIAGALMLAGAAYAAWDHRRIEVIFAPPPGAGVLEARIARGQQSWLFGHHADYAAVTTRRGEQDLATFRRPLHQLVDVRLLIAYIEALKAAGQHDRALYAAQRLREFRRPEAQAYFMDCDSRQAPRPWQCERSPVRLTWRDMEP